MSLPAQRASVILPPPSPQWAQDSCAIVRQSGFYPARRTIGADYLQRWQPLAERQLRLAGSDLAATLNAALR